MAADMKLARAELERRRRALLRSWRAGQLQEDELIDDKRPEWCELSATQRLAELVERVGEREVAELTAIVAALRRMDDGTWGRCETCGEAIAVERLRVLPEARLCAS